MRVAVLRGATYAVLLNLVVWFAAAAAGIVPPTLESIPTVVGVVVASAAGVAAAGVVAQRFLATWRRVIWDRVALVVLLMSFGSPLGLAIGAIPVSPIDPSNPLLISFKEGIALVYAALHLTTYVAVQRTIAREFAR
jgi:hypothetical protein